MHLNTHPQAQGRPLGVQGPAVRQRPRILRRCGRRAQAWGQGDNHFSLCRYSSKSSQFIGVDLESTCRQVHPVPSLCSSGSEYEPGAVEEAGGWCTGASSKSRRKQLRSPYVLLSVSGTRTFQCPPWLLKYVLSANHNIALDTGIVGILIGMAQWFRLLLMNAWCKDSRQEIDGANQTQTFTGYEACESRF